MNQKYEKLKRLLKELFQLDQPDLDFGLYRIMHAKSEEVTRFLEEDLLPQVRVALGQHKVADKLELEKELRKIISGIEEAGMNSEDSPKVKELQRKLKNDAIDVSKLESDVYEHLFGFFRRYYSEGDFLAKRVYKPGVYAIPYEGEEVTLHWANKDQYYIKTSEYLRDYVFRLKPNDEKNPMRVHLRLVNAVEGEHGNVKAAAGSNRVFILSKGDSGHDFVVEEDSGQGKELVIYFEYRSATLTDWPEGEAVGKKGPPAQKNLTAYSIKHILGVKDKRLVEWISEVSKPHIKASGEKADYSRLEAHLGRYTARNTFDYFIHKDLGTFLRRELDFYIKNEVMLLDDVDNENELRVEQYISKIKVIRKIAEKIIDFLAQLENFQKKLWLKKKFVVESNYCIRVGIIPASFYAEISMNEAQIEEWVKLCTIDEKKDVHTTTDYSENFGLELLKTHPTLVVDTRHFNLEFTARLLEALGDLNEQTNGVLFHSENFQALMLMQARYKELVKCIYIDPPYNTEKDTFIYKDGYKRSSWLSLTNDRIVIARRLLKHDGIFMSSIDEHETANLRSICENQFGVAGFAAELIWNTQHSQQSGLFAPYHEYVQVYTNCPAKNMENFQGGDGEIVAGALKKPSSGNPPTDFTFPAGVRWEASDGTELSGAWGDVETVELISGCMLCENMKLKYPVTLKAGWTQKLQMEKYFAGIRPVKDSKGQEVTEFYFSSTGKLKITKKRSRITPNTILPAFGTVSAATANLKAMFGMEVFGRPKPVPMMEYLIALPTNQHEHQLVLDYFAGSGTTGHATISLNRKDGGRRNFVLVEMGDYFDTVLLPRIKKVTFTPEWKGGKPARLITTEEVESSPRIVKIIRLESYEDTLNNLKIDRTDDQQLLLNKAEAQGEDKLREQYLLNYMLDVETRGSQSLLNVRAFSDPTAYTLKVKRRGSDENREVIVDLLETFNWLIGLTVRNITMPQTFKASFERDNEGRLRLKGDGLESDKKGPYWFRTVTGFTPDDHRILIIWRKLTVKQEHDNLVLDKWFAQLCQSISSSEFDQIYVNGSNNLENLKTQNDLWKVRLIEENFFRLMFDTEGT